MRSALEASRAAKERELAELRRQNVDVAASNGAVVVGRVFLFIDLSFLAELQRKQQEEADAVRFSLSF